MVSWNYLEKSCVITFDITWMVRACIIRTGWRLELVVKVLVTFRITNALCTWSDKYQESSSPNNLFTEKLRVEYSGLGIRSAACVSNAQIKTDDACITHLKKLCTICHRLEYTVHVSRLLISASRCKHGDGGMDLNGADVGLTGCVGRREYRKLKGTGSWQSDAGFDVLGLRCLDGTTAIARRPWWNFRQVISPFCGVAVPPV